MREQVCADAIVPKREPQAVVAMRRLNNANDRLRGLLDQMEKRLDPVLSPEPPQQCAPQEKQPNLLAGLPNAMEIQASSIDENCDRLKRMLNRLEV